jgi:formyltetrahydrofolate deformylase
MAAMTHPEYILTLSCLDQRGIVHRVSASWPTTAATSSTPPVRRQRIEAVLHARALRAGRPHRQRRPAARRLRRLCGHMKLAGQMHDAARKPRVMLMVSKIGHCLNDLLFRYKSGLLPVEIPAIVSNHMEFYQLAASYNIPFHHLPLEAGRQRIRQAGAGSRIIELMDTAQDRPGGAGALHADPVAGPVQR